MLSSAAATQTHCLNPTCSAPINAADASCCKTCDRTLLTKDRYRPIALIGQGGFGRTFKAIDESKSHRPLCAIKQSWTSQENAHDPKVKQRFEQEAQKLAQLSDHPQIPTFLDSHADESGYYIVQEFIHGQNLAQLLTQSGSWREKEIKKLLESLLPVLAFVHEKHQIIHRDIKPENIIRRESNGSWMLVDFGASKQVSEENIGKTGTVIGSAAYTAPEQVIGKAIYASDLYSLGVTCIHLLTEVPPFQLFDSSSHSWAWRGYLKKPISRKLEKVLNRMLAPATKKRYATAKSALSDIKGRRKPLKRVAIVGSIGLFFILGGRGLMRPYALQTSGGYVITDRRTADTPTEPGGLFGRNAEGAEQAFPLENTAVDARISGNISRVEVRQTFTNPYDQPIEAVYRFPLPDDAAVDDMEIQIGDRTIRGLIKEREEAQEIYEEAKEAGQTAGLLEQDRPNLFVQSLANVLPGESIEVVIRYSNRLDFVGNEYEFAFPLAVAPRYEPGGDNVITPAGSAVATINPPFLSEGTRSGHDVDMTVEIDAGVPISGIESPSHDVVTSQNSGIAQISLADEETIPNKDFILRYQIAGAETQATVLTQADERGGHFSTYLIPAVDYAADEIVPKDVVFLIDTSGSQHGEPMAQSKEMMRQFISALNPEDTFSIINFSNSSQALAREPLTNTRENRSRALRYVDRLQANGGTNFMEGIDAVLDFPEPEAGRLRSVVLISDGQIGNDEEIVGTVRDQLQAGNRLYSFGVGYSTNRFLLDRLAEVGRGTSTVVAPEDDPVSVAESFYTEINNPVVTDIEVSWVGEGESPVFYPQTLPDLFTGEPLVVHGRKGDGTSGQLQVTGTVADGSTYTEVLDVDFGGVTGNGAIAQQWGRARIQDLMNDMYGRETPEAIIAVTETALAYRLLSKYTAFVAVTEEVRVDQPGSTETVEVPTELPPNAGGYSSGGEPVPEPSTIIGNGLVILFLLLFFARKRWQKWLVAMPAATSVEGKK